MPRENVVEIARPGAAGLGSDTDDALAREFVIRHHRDFKFVANYGWIVWTGYRFERDDKLRRFDLIRHIVRERGESGASAAEVRRIESARTVHAVESLAKSDPLLVRVVSDLDADPLELNTPGGVVELRSGRVRAHDRDLVTRATAVAPDFAARSTAWAAFLADVFDGDVATLEFLQTLLGYCITADVREQVIGFFHGEGSNGKSTLLDLLLYVLDDYAAKAPTTMLMAQRGERHPTDVASLCGVRLAVANEVAEGEHWDEARVKELTGDATLTARFMRQDFFQFRATHKFIVAANHRPQVRSMDHAMRRRLLLLPFAARFDGDRRDQGMLSKLKGEAPAVLAWLIHGAQRWLEEGLTVPAGVRQASDAYVDAMDSLGLWLDECVDRSDPEAREKADTLYKSYGCWKKDRGEAPVSMTRWGETMLSRGFQKVKSNGVRYLGIRLTADAAAHLLNEGRP